MTMRVAGGADREAFATMMARAFADDPAMSFIFPDPADRAKRLPRLFRLLFDADAGGMRLMSAGGEAATLWRGPGSARTSVWEMIRSALPMWRALGPNIRRALAVANTLETYLPDGDFWYLHFAGCDPAVQGKGFGGRAVRAGLERVAGRLPAYLETATERNLGFYRALGFEIRDEWTIAGSDLHFWSMSRPAG